MQKFVISAAFALLAGAATAEEAKTYVTDLSFEDVTFGLETAIADQGLVIDHVSHTGDMLERTKDAVGSDVVIFTHADIYSFCSAKLSRKVMEINPANVQYCPYHIFAYQTPDNPDQVIVGHRTFPEGEMKEVEALLSEIAQTAIEE